MTHPIQFKVSPNDFREVHAILQAHVAYEHAKAMRQFWVHVLALVGCLSALWLIFPQWSGAQMRAVLLAFWGACVACVVISGGAEWVWHRREARLLSANAVHTDP